MEGDKRGGYVEAGHGSKSREKYIICENVSMVKRIQGRIMGIHE